MKRFHDYSRFLWAIGDSMTCLEVEPLGALLRRRVDAFLSFLRIPIPRSERHLIDCI